MQKVMGTVVTNYVYDAQGQLAAEYAPQPAASDCGTPTCYFTEDHLGSTRLVIDSNGNAAKRFDYLPFGEETFAGIGGRTTAQGYLSAPDPLNPKFSGKVRDNETGLDWFEVRYDSSAQGRFTSPDPLGGTLTDPQTLNKYSYVRNNPLSLTDPTGLYVCADDKRGTETHCTSDQDIAFEKSRQGDLKSKDGNVVRGASSYGDPGKDNGVTVKFGDPGKGNDAVTSHGLGQDPSDSNKMRAEETVTVKSGLSGSALDAAVGHEGSHVADAQNFAATANANGNFDVSKNLSQYQTEFKAYMNTNSILNSEVPPAPASYGQCNNGPCILGQGASLKSVTNTINQLLANPKNGYGVTPANPGKLLYPILTTPQKPQ